MGSFAEKEQARKKKSVVSTIAGVDNEQIKGQISIETFEDGKYMPEPPIKEKKKAGRPKLENRELRKRYSFTILPSVYDKAQEKANAEGKALSEIVAKYLAEYIKN